MAKMQIFRCAGIESSGADDKGELAVADLIEVDGRRLRLLCPPEGITEIVNRLQGAADLAISRRAAASLAPSEYRAVLAPQLTDHHAEPSDDARSVVLTLITGKSKLPVTIPRADSPKVRETLERVEKEADEKKRSLTH